MLAVGDTLALPVRLLGQAGPGEVVVSPEVGRLVEGWVALEARGVRRRAGDPASVDGYAVVGARPGRAALPPDGGQSRGPFVGRARELALLEAVWEQVTAGQGQVVGLVGAAGMGKSRCLTEWRHRCSAQGTPYREGECLAYGSATPYLPVLGLLREHCGLTEGDRPEALTAKVRLALEPSGSDLEVGVPVLLDLLGVPVEAERLAGLSAEARRARAFETLRQMFLASSQRQPLVLAVDNLHWIDPTSEAFLALLIEQMAGVSLLVLTTTRPGYRPPWGDRSYVTQLALAPLDPEASRQVVRRVLADRSLAPALEQQLLARAEGNPFFLEELAHTVREQEGPQGVLAVPDTIQAVLAARLDRVPAPEQRVLQAAAVIGKEVALPLLHALLGLPEATVQRSLAHLQAAEFVFLTRVVPTPTYTFKHILTHEAVYQSVPMPTRRQDHRRVAQVLAEHFPDTAEAHPELLAQHYTEAGLAASAVAYWQRAGQQAVERAAYQEAIIHLTTGLEILQALPETPEKTQHELALQTTLGAALLATKGYGAPEVEGAYARARQLCQRLGDTQQLFPILLGLMRVYLTRSEPETARELGEECMRLAQRTPDPTRRIEGHMALAYPLAWLGEFASACAHFEQAIALYDPRLHHALAFRNGEDPGVACLSRGAMVLWLLGYPDQARTNLQNALALAQEHSHPFSLAICLYYTARLHQFQREVQRTRERAEVLMTLCTEQGFAHFLALGTILRGWTLCENGQGEEGIAQMRQGQMAYRAAGSAAGGPYFLALLAEAYGKSGHREPGLQVLVEALAAVEQSGERMWEAELHRLKGVLLLSLSVENQTAVEACFRQALAVARRQQAKALELRAAMSLAQLWQHQGKRAEARQLLGEVYSWFTEGFDTADLQEAQALLTALG